MEADGEVVSSNLFGDILREYLYVDTERVWAMLAQREGGVEEEGSATLRSGRQTGAVLRGAVDHRPDGGRQARVTKGLGDLLFPTLEDSLESAGLLVDVSDELKDEHYWESGQLVRELPVGSLVRLTAPGSLFDARYVAHMCAGFGVVRSGLQAMGAIPAPPRTPAPKGPNIPGKNQGRRQPDANDCPQSEDLIPKVGQMGGDDRGHIDDELLRAIVKVARGLFTPGLHLNLMPTKNDALLVGARLQEGRQFLGSDPEILFARYGVRAQEWTVVGTVGHHGERMSGAPPDPGLSGPDGVMRGRTAAYVNAMLGYLGGLGFADLPQHPSFSLVPLAVYRYLTPPRTSR